MNNLTLASKVLLFLLFFVMACEEPEDDFTVGNFYPIEVENEPDKPNTDIPKANPVAVNPQLCWDENIEARHNTTFNDYFTRYDGGWTGGDATYSIPIDENTHLWLFGDTFLGTVRSDRSRPGSKLYNNTFVLQKGEEFTTYHGGTTANPEAFLKPPEEDWWYWPGHGQLHEGTIQIIMFAMGQTSEGGQFGFEYKALDLYTLSLPDLSILSQERKMLFAGTNFGATLMQSGGYTYIYGAEKVAVNKFLHVARVEGTDLSQDWEHFAGQGTWSMKETDSKAIFSNVSEQFSVIQRPEGFYLMTQNYFLGSQLYLYSGATPLGPFDNEQTLYCTPETAEGNFTYNAFVHEQFSTDDTLLISYNVNSRAFADLFRNADNYRPYFVNVTGWR